MAASRPVPQEDRAPPAARRGPLAALARLRESPLAMTGAALLLFWVLVALLAPVLPLLDPNQPMEPFKFPGDVARDGQTVFWLGTDHKGRDLLSRLIWGSRRVLVWSSLATASAYVVGVLMGLVAGYRGGWRDEVISFVGNVLLSFPVMVLYIVVITRLGASGLNIVLAVTFASAPGIMRIVRGLALDLKSRDYVQAARARGESSLYIMLNELLPNVRGPLIVDACLRLGYTTVTIAMLGFLGLGLPPPDPDWGRMIAETQPLGSLAGHMALLPAAAITSLVLGFNLLADGLREITLRD